MWQWLSITPRGSGSMKLLHEHVGARAESKPDSTAVVMKDESLTYAELERTANRLARVLRAVGCRKGDRVCLVLPKSMAAIISIVGVLKAGCIYVPVDSTSPLARIEKIVDSCQPTCILGAGPVTSLLNGLFRTEPSQFRVGWMGDQPPEERSFAVSFSAADLEAEAGERIDCGTSPDDAAHILFTSGSTGTPKGVVITHANVNHFLDWAVPHFGIAPTDRVSGHPPLHFDLSTFDIFGTFAAGAQLHLVPPELNLLAHKLAGFIRDSELTQWFSVPSTLSYIAAFDVVQFNDFPSLKRLLWCGEVLPIRTLAYWMKRVPHATFTNLYGPTEATIASSFHTVSNVPLDESIPIPIGVACKGETLLVLDEELRPCKPGEVGELYIQGVGLSPGYWRDTEKTDAAFLNLRNERGDYDRIYKTGDLAKVASDGLVHYLGRSDSQIKSRGYRIELGEIEAALNSLDILSEVAVISIPSEGFDGLSICCAYVPSAAQLAPAAIGGELGRIIPHYMIPTLWQAFDALPKNQNGKIDRNLLRKLFLSNQTHSASVA